VKSEKIKILFFLLAFCLIRCGSALGAAAPQITLTPALGNTNMAKPLSMAPIPNISQLPSSIEPQSVDFALCNKNFRLIKEKLFYLTLASINANRFMILEIQSNSGYILLSVKQKKFLASIVELNSQNSMLKITPCDNIYYFPVAIVQNMFKYIELNFAFGVEQLSVIK